MRRSIAFVGLVAMLAVAACGGNPAATAGTPAPAVPSAPAVVSPPAGQGPASSATASSAPAAGSSAPAAASPSTGGPTPPQPGRPCTSADLTAQITSWDGAMGSQIANIRLANASAVACLLQGTPQLQLVDAAGHVLIDSKTQGAAGLAHVSPGDKTWTIQPLGRITTMVRVANYCGATTPSLPTTVAFILPLDGGRIVARANAAGVAPGCLGSPGDAGSIQMNGWAP